MARKQIDKLKEAFIERIFSYDECLIDSLMRIDDENIGLFGCRDCVFRDMLREEVCFTEVKQEVRGLLK